MDQLTLLGKELHISLSFFKNDRNSKHEARNPKIKILKS